jgi:hypothetical protein
MSKTTTNSNDTSPLDDFGQQMRPALQYNPSASPPPTHPHSREQLKIWKPFPKWIEENQGQVYINSVLKHKTGPIIIYSLTFYYKFDFVSVWFPLPPPPLSFEIDTNKTRNVVKRVYFRTAAWAEKEDRFFFWNKRRALFVISLVVVVIIKRYIYYYISSFALLFLWFALNDLV